MRSANPLSHRQGFPRASANARESVIRRNMVPLDPPSAAPVLPPIVGIVLSQIARLRFRGALTEGGFKEKIARITQEELEPRGLLLLVRELSGGRVRFLVKAANGRICDLVEYPPEAECCAAEVLLSGGNAVDQIPETIFADGAVRACR